MTPNLWFEYVASTVLGIGLPLFVLWFFAMLFGFFDKD